jgi:hypothetical protein
VRASPREEFPWHGGDRELIFPFILDGTGALAQLVERFNGIEEVSGSTPLCSTTY